jgi:predicted Rossmann fold nucleotide-binding protein DprA/Smf involved in DNA uptake
MQLNEIAVIQRNSAEYPVNLKTHLIKQPHEKIYALGDSLILQQKKIALFCSVKCPGEIILRLYEFIKNSTRKDVAFIGGFHSPMEQECLNILFRGKTPVVVCPARALQGMRIKKEFRKPIEEGRLLLFSPFHENHNRMSMKNSAIRNYFAAAVADAAFVAYAAPQSKTETFSKELIAQGKPVYTLKSDLNKKLIAMGAIPVSHEKPIFM